MEPNSEGAFGAFDDADFVALVSGEMQRDVTAVVYVGATELRSVGHCGENGISDGAGDGGHGSDEAAMAIGQDSVEHAAGDAVTARLKPDLNASAERRAEVPLHSSPRTVVNRLAPRGAMVAIGFPGLGGAANFACSARRR